MTYYDLILKYDWETTRRKIYASTDADVERALAHDRPSMDDFAALVSPAADKYLDAMAAESYRITRRRFGNVMQLYIPLYLANICQNHCVYCGFNCTNKIHRAILTPDEIHEECRAIKKDPFQHILLVTGEAPRSSSVQYMADSMEIVKQYFQQISLEVQPLETDEYRLLMDHGLHSVYVYQETYNRLETPDRLCEAGVYKVGVGNLIGLEDWRTEAFFTALHVRYLENRYWRTKYSVAFPRLRPYVGEDGFNPEHPASERNLFQLICAYRLLSEDVELSISTRESADFRDRVVHHLLFNYIAPMLERTFIADSYSCRKGMGTLYGIRRLERHIRSCSDNFRRECYVLKLDIRGYFMNIDRRKLYGMLVDTFARRGSSCSTTV